MRGAQTYQAEGFRGLMRDVAPVPGVVDRLSAYKANNIRISDTLGAVEKLGGRATIYNTVWASSKLPGHVLGLIEARLGTSNHVVGCLSADDLSAQFIANWAYSEPTWTATDITRTAYSPQCPNNRRMSFAVLKDLLVMSDFGVSALEKWDGTVATNSTAALTTTNGPTKARYLHTVRDFMFTGYLTDGNNIYGGGANAIYPDYVHWCDAGNPDSWTTTNYFALTTRDNAAGAGITGISSIQALVVVFKADSIWVGGYVGSPDYWTFENLVPDKGTVSPWAIVSVYNSLYFVGTDGVYVFDGSPKPRKVSGVKVSNYFANRVSEDDGYQIWGYAHPFKPEIWFCTQRTDVPTWIYNYQTDDWYNSDIKCESMTRARRTQAATWDSLASEANRYTWDSIAFKSGPRTWDEAFTTTNGDILMAGAPSTDTDTNRQANLFEADIGTYHDKSSTATSTETCTYRSQNIDCGLPNAKKRFLGATLKLKPVESTLLVRFIVDGVQVGADISLSITASNKDYEEYTVYRNSIGVSIQIEIENATATESFQLLGYSIYYIPREAVR